MIIQVSGGLNRTVDSDCAIVIFRVKVTCISSVDGVQL